MDAISPQAGLTRTGDASALAAQTRMPDRLLLTMAQTAAERLVSSQRDPPPPDSYRLPLA